MKQKLVITAFFFLLFIGAQAQDKYQFMVIKLRLSGDPTLCISLDGEEYIKEKVEQPKEIGMNVNPVLKKLKELQTKGWEVMSFEEGAFVAYLRKKIETK